LKKSIAQNALNKFCASLDRKSCQKLFRRQTPAAFALQFQNPQRLITRGGLFYGKRRENLFVHNHHNECLLL
jgi:hypothetical protein